MKEKQITRQQKINKGRRRNSPTKGELKRKKGRIRERIRKEEMNEEGE